VSIFKRGEIAPKGRVQTGFPRNSFVDLENYPKGWSHLMVKQV